MQFCTLWCQNILSIRGVQNSNEVANIEINKMPETFRRTQYLQ